MSVQNHPRRWCLLSNFSHLFFLIFLVSSSRQDELQPLLKFKSSLLNSNTNVFSTWRTENPVCNFTGVLCNGDGLVSEIALPGRNLAGVLPFDSICELGSLEKLWLGGNFLHGRISDELRKCKSLQVLDLGVNSFSGSVPDLSSLVELRLLSLNSSGISGSFPWSSLRNLTKLEFLSLGDNQLEKTSSFPMELVKFENLYWLYLSNCSVSGMIPEEISNLVRLENLEIADGFLFGEIPAGIGKLSKLRQLELYNNNLSGKFPVGFGNLTNLVNFDASINNLEGDLAELKPMKKLSSLQLFSNHFYGEIPEEFGDLKNLTELSLYSNQLTGPLPQKLGSWSDFTYIDVAENLLTGPIPPDMCKNGKFIRLLLLQNQFTGQIPDSYANCKSLIRIRVNNNSLSGVVPAGIWGLPDVFIIDLGMNQFEGPITSDISNAKSLGSLDLANNRFSGMLPPSISQASSLVSLKLSSNQFSGEIPETIGELKNLGNIYLTDNMLSGTIPVSLGSCVSLTDINLSGNMLSGEIPKSLGDLHSLNSLNLSKNNLSGEIPDSLASLRMSNLDLSSNQLTGSIPESLALEAFRDGFDGNPGLCSENLKDFPLCSSNPMKSSPHRLFLFCFAAGLLVLVILAGSYMFLKLRPNNIDHPLKQSSWKMRSFRVLTFTENEIIDAIKAENLIGKGGSGNVYKAVLGNGTELAVKHIWASNSSDWFHLKSSSAMLSKRSTQCREFEAEVATLSAVRHVNLVKLYCSITSDDSNLLVYEYLPNGSLWDCLHSCYKIKMGWDVRYAVALGAAKGLEYLHHGCDRPVIHRDVKSSNILLDDEWKPRLADFGLAKIVQAGAGGGDWTHAIAGTYGYIAPEYAYTSKITVKSDVYSFGVVLMELVTGKKPIESGFGENKDIVSWIYSNMKSRDDVLGLVDTEIPDTVKEDAVKVLRIATHCTAKIPALRPSMRMVVQMLEEADPGEFMSIVVDTKGGGNSQD